MPKDLKQVMEAGDLPKDGRANGNQSCTYFNGKYVAAVLTANPGKWFKVQVDYGSKTNGSASKTAQKISQGLVRYFRPTYTFEAHSRKIKVNDKYSHTEVWARYNGPLEGIGEISNGR